MVTRKAGAALAAGCSVVMRPSESTPLTCLALARAFADAGLPEHVLEVVTSLNAPPAGDLLCRHPAIAKITFTGSTRVGTLLAELASRHNKRIGLELGGHAPFIVFPDADPADVVAAVAASRFRNAGQSCISTNRLIVHRDVADAVATRLADAVGGLKVGDGMAPGTQIGPLIDEAAAQRLRRLQADALAKGARVLAAGDLTDVRGLAGAFYAPTVVTDVRRDAAMLTEEVFGPLLSLSVFTRPGEAVELANSTDYGLAAYVFTQDLTTAWRVAEALNFGVVGINDPAPSAPGLPFGGMKSSGLGRENGPEGVDAFMETKSVSMKLRPGGPLDGPAA
jgi:succinate-semialdehyde dehydrogenase/glutarate-semialdehyde dehydrogenase